METCFIISSSSIFSWFFIFLFASFTLSSRNDDSRALSSHSSTLFFGLSHAITSSVKDIVPTGLLYKVPPIYYSVVHRRSILHYIYVASGRDSVILNSYSRLRVDFFFYRDVPKTEISHHTRSKDAFLDVLVPRGTRDVDPGGGGRRSVLKKKSIFSNSSCISWKNSSLPRGFWDLNLEYQAG